MFEKYRSSGRSWASGTGKRHGGGALRRLVNNAGISNDGGQRGVDADLERVREALEANLFGAWRLCEAFIPLMQRQGYGRIVNISSGMGGSEASRPVEEGADTPVWAATLPDDGPTGGFFRDRRQIPW